jgi:hypothetical protein
MFFPCTANLPRSYRDRCREFSVTIIATIAATIAACLQQSSVHILPRPFPRSYRDFCREHRRDFCREHCRDFCRTFFRDYNLSVYREYLRALCHNYSKKCQLHFFILIAAHLPQGFLHILPLVCYDIAAMLPHTCRTLAASFPLVCRIVAAMFPRNFRDQTNQSSFKLISSQSEV